MNGRRWLLLALVLSAALNLFLGGFWLGGRLTARSEPSYQLRADRGPLQGLPPERRRELKRRLRAETVSGLPDVRAARAARRAAGEVLAAEPLDRAAALRALEQARVAEGRLRSRVDTALVDYAAGLPPGERAVFAEAVGRGFGARPIRPEHGGRRPPRD